MLGLFLGVILYYTYWCNFLFSFTGSGRGVLWESAASLAMVFICLGAELGAWVLGSVFFSLFSGLVSNIKAFIGVFIIQSQTADAGTRDGILHQTVNGEIMISEVFAFVDATPGA